MTSRDEGAARHALAWLVAGNAVGVLLAALLLAPRLNDALAPLTYGRWVPVHLNAQLYGWGSLPLVALLLAFFGAQGVLARAAVRAWSAMLVVGCVSWLGGSTSGKPFLEWSGAARVAMVVGMSVLTVALAVAARGDRTKPDPASGGSRAARWLLLIALGAVPFVIAWAASPRVYPAINPDSGGPTGVSLMGSVLGIVALVLATPPMLGLRSTRPRFIAGSWLALGAHAIAFALLPHGDASHRSVVQIVALASVAPWVPLLALAMRAHEWPEASATWLRGALGWGIALAASGILAFLPGVLERAKFSHALVAHAHVALAGLVTSWNLAILGALGGAVGDLRLARAWHATLALHVASLAGLAVLEERAAGGLLPATRAATALLVARLLAGLGQLGVSWAWLRRQACAT